MKQNSKEATARLSVTSRSAEGGEHLSYLEQAPPGNLEKSGGKMRLLSPSSVARTADWVAGGQDAGLG